MTRQGAGFGDEIRAFFLYLWPLRSPKEPNIEKTEKNCQKYHDQAGKQVGEME